MLYLNRLSRCTDNFVTDQGQYFSEAINSGAKAPPVEPAILAGIVAPLVQGKSDYCFTQHGKEYLCLFRLEDLGTMTGGGIQVMLVTDADWLGKEAKQSRSLQALMLIGAGMVLAVFAAVLRGVASLRTSERLNRTIERRDVQDSG